MRSSASNAATEARSHVALAPTLPRPRTEEELLEREEYRARLDLRNELTGLRDDFLATTALPRYAIEHPVVAMLVSAAAGFAIARPLRRAGSMVGMDRFGAAAREIAKHLGVGGAASRVIADMLRNGRSGR